jgi:hypothetical protein
MYSLHTIDVCINPFILFMLAMKLINWLSQKIDILKKTIAIYSKFTLHFLYIPIEKRCVYFVLKIIDFRVPKKYTNCFVLDQVF